MGKYSVRTSEKKKSVMVAFRPSQLARVSKCLETEGTSRSLLIELLLDKWLEEQEEKSKK